MFKFILIGMTVQMLIRRYNITMGGGVMFVSISQIPFTVEHSLFFYLIADIFLFMLSTNGILLFSYMGPVYNKYNKFND